MPRPRLLLLAAVLVLVFLPRPGRSAERNEEDNATIRGNEARLISDLRRDPGNKIVATQLAKFYTDWRSSLRTPGPALLDLVRTTRDPARLIGFFTDWVGDGDHPFEAQIALAALAARPADPALWDIVAMVVPEPWKIPFQEEAFRVRLAAPAAAAATPSASALAARWINRLLARGLLHRALAVYRELTPEVRAAIDDDSAIPGGRFTSYSDERRDLRLELAAAAFLDGDRETAGRLLGIATRQPAVRPPLEEHEKDTLLLLRRLVERALAAPSDDGFDLLTEPLVDTMMQGQSMLPSLLTARLAEREAYPALAAYELKEAVYFLQDRESEPFEPDPGLPARLRTTKEEIAAEREALAKGLEDEAQAVAAAARTVLGPDPAAPVIARLLAAPAEPVFAERRLPEGAKPVLLSDEQIRARLKAAAQSVHLPPGLNVIRLDREGEQVAVIVASQGLDPVGELSSGGYWVLLSKDGGATWGTPLYTGLRLNQPYVVRSFSALPLLAGDRLQVEVEVRELDPERIVFPPIDLAAKRVAQGLFLDLPLAALTRDSDGDGLTDLTEARLLTDPHAADTDGDGLVDGDDPLPGVPQSAATSAATEALAAVVRKIAGVGGRALIQGVAGMTGGVACCGPRQGPPTIEPAVFFIGARPLFAGLRPDRRLVVLTRDEADAARKTFGPFYPLELTLFFFDHAGHRAFVIWSASWQGGTLRLEEKNGQWTVEEVGAWIT